MPDFSMFGPAQSGVRLAEQDWLSNQLKLGKIADMPWQIRGDRAAALKAEQQLADEQKWSHLLSTMSTPGGAEAVTSNKPQDLGSKFEDLANMAMKAGLPEQATKLATTAAGIKAKEASVARANAAVRLDTLKAQGAQAAMIGGLYGAVTDQDSFDRANMLFQVQTGKVSPYAGLPYSKEMVKGIVDGSMKAADQIKLRLQAEENASKERNRRSLEDHRKKVEDYLDARKKLAQDRENRLKKTGGGKAVTSPAKSEVDEAINMINGEYAELSNADKVSAAFEVASEARALRQQNPALSASEALNRAFLAAKQRGDFHLITEKSWYGGVSKKEKFVGGGRSPESAIPVPAEASARVAGRWYYNSQGQIAQWTGKGWQLAPKTSGLSTNNSTGIPPLLARPQ